MTTSGCGGMQARVERVSSGGSNQSFLPSASECVDYSPNLPAGWSTKTNVSIPPQVLLYESRDFGTMLPLPTVINCQIQVPGDPFTSGSPLDPPFLECYFDTPRELTPEEFWAQLDEIQIVSTPVLVYRAP